MSKKVSGAKRLMPYYIENKVITPLSLDAYGAFYGYIAVPCELPSKCTLSEKTDIWSWL